MGVTMKESSLTVVNCGDTNDIGWFVRGTEVREWVGTYKM